MKKITQAIEYEGHGASDLRSILKNWHELHPFDTGIDWEFQYLWAIMTDEDCLAFCLKYPEYAQQFRTV